LILLPGMGDAPQYTAGSTIKASGVHFGWNLVPQDLFTSMPNHEGYGLPLLVADIASGGCMQS